MSDSFYTIPIPKPDDAANLQQLAQIKRGKLELFEFFWRSETRQVVICRSQSSWFIQPNALIMNSLSALLNCKPCNIIAKDVYIFDSPQKSAPANAETNIALYSCEWSDYAMDKMCIQFIIELHYSCTTEAARTLRVVRSIIEDEELYADMPGLIPMDASCSGCTKYVSDRETGEGNSYCECVD